MNKFSDKYVLTFDLWWKEEKKVSNDFLDKSLGAIFKDTKITFVSRTDLWTDGEKEKRYSHRSFWPVFFFSNTIMMSPLIQCLVRSFFNGDVKWKREGMMYVNISQEKNGGWNSVNRSIERDNRWLPIGMTHWTSCSHVIDERWFDSFVRLPPVSSKTTCCVMKDIWAFSRVCIEYSFFKVNAFLRIWDGWITELSFSSNIHRIYRLSIARISEVTSADIRFDFRHFHDNQWNFGCIGNLAQASRMNV